MKQPLVSVIIPVYMVSDYLDRCIKSVVDQRYSHLEIILVDDGSSDDCAHQCDEWAKKDDRITVIHKLNGGQADARNYAVQIAYGEYISYIDSDDYISDDFIEVLLSTALTHNSDIAVCDHIKFDAGGKYEEYHDDLAVRDYSTTEGLLDVIEGKQFHLHVWDKLYKRDVVQNVYFDAGKIHEDVFWIYQTFGNAKRITKINRTLYFYLQRESSTMGQGYSLRSMDFLEGKNKSRLYIETHFPELALQAKLDFFGSCMYTLQCVIKYMSGKDKRQAIAIIRKYKKKCRLTFKDIKAVPDNSKKYFYLAKINLYLCCWLRATLNIGF